MIEKAMSITPIVFVLIILLFGFDSTEQVKTARNPNQGQQGAAALKDRARNL